jgi:superfamily II DNA or RNA helicase
MGLGDFTYDTEHRIIICLLCQTCLSTGGPKYWKRHLQGGQHQLAGPQLKATVNLLQSAYGDIGRATSIEELRRQRPSRRSPCRRVSGLEVYRGYICLCDEAGCDYATRHLKKMRDHVPGHGRKAPEHDGAQGPLWRACLLQTYFAAKGLIDYFVVQGDDSAEAAAAEGYPGALGGLGPPPSQPERQLLEAARADIQQARKDVDSAASAVQEVGGGRAEEEGWLLQTGIAAHLRGLLNEEIGSSYRLPAAAARALVGAAGPGVHTKAHSGGGRGSGSSNSDSDNSDSSSSGGGGSSDSSDSDGSGGGGGSEEDGSSGRVAQAEGDIERIGAAVEQLLRSAYCLAADRSENRAMTQQRAQRLSDFAHAEGGSASRRSKGFRSLKNEATLGTYFRKVRELLAYYYRVVYSEGGHFTRPPAGGEVGRKLPVPRDSIRPTARQRQAMICLVGQLRQQDRLRPEGPDTGGAAAAAAELIPATRELLLALICHTVGARPYRSAVVSFCAMHSRQKLSSRGSSHRAALLQQGKTGGTGDEEEDRRTRRQPSQKTTWKAAGNYSSHLSAMIWTAQLILFEHAYTVAASAGAAGLDNGNGDADDEGSDDEGSNDEVLGLLDDLCRGFMNQRGETAFGHLLQWRLYLSAVAQSAISRHQARWSLDGKRFTLMGVMIGIDDISRLIAAEFSRAQRLLGVDLLFGAAAEGLLPRLAAWQLHDDLDDEEFGGSWLTDTRNRELLGGAQEALLGLIEARPDLRGAFITTAAGGGRSRFSGEAIALYEATVQEFLGSLGVLVHLAPLPPLRSPELLSATASNGGSRRRSIFIWERLVMLHVRYHKSQRQTGRPLDNVRFLPAAIGDLLLAFLAYVQPLRQTFLRQAEPGALLSPLLWSRADGSPWPDQALGQCLSRACARAEVPPFGVAWWRQAAASITKEKFTPQEQASLRAAGAGSDGYGEGGGGGGEGEGEGGEGPSLLRDLAESSNHSLRTFDHAYAGSTTLTMNTLLHRAYRASASWRALFGTDELLAAELAAGAGAGARGGRRKRARLGEDGGPGGNGDGLPDRCKRARLRQRPLAKQGTLTAIARRLYDRPTLQLRAGQREAMLAALGPGAGEQVVVVLGTGSGKSMVIMAAAAMEGAATTILVLPTVALRTNMLGRVRRAGIRAVEWSPGLTGAAPLIVASAEAACSQGFAEYAGRLELRQQLDRIIVDEAHLTLTASSYRRSMRALGWHVRQVRTQTVWLTATLPPALEAAFAERNLLTRPRVVRASTNRANLRYRLERYDGGRQSLASAAADLARPYCAALGGSARDRLIIYCRTITLMEAVAAELGCLTYTGDGSVMSPEDRERALARWESAEGSPAIAATSALSVGYDYAHVRCTIHAGAPELMTDFAQESGRAGRDGEPAECLILTPRGAAAAAAAAGGDGHHPDPDRDSMRLYLSGQHCLRAVMSQFLDAPADWRWCMRGEDERCGICPVAHLEPRPPGLRVPPSPSPSPRATGAVAVLLPGDQAWEASAAMQFTGPREVGRQGRVQQEALDRLEAGLAALIGSCPLCRIGGRPFDHTAGTCSRRSEWVGAKRQALASCKKQGRPWMTRYTACFHCCMPQTICREADPEARQGGGCRYRDLILPLCFGAFFHATLRAVITREFRGFANIGEYMLWLGRPGELGGDPCVEGVRLAARLLEELGLP